MKRCFLIVVVCILSALISVFAYSENFYFVQITDTHLGAGNHIERLKKIVSSVNRLPVELKFAVITGDIANDNVSDDEIMQEGLTLFKKLKCPVYFTPGNHDILPMLKEQDIASYGKYYGELYQTIDTSGLRLVFFYNEPLRNPAMTIPGIDPLPWLLKALSGSEANIVFLHSPPVEDFYNNTFHESWTQENRDKFSQIINSNKVIGVLAGHFHRDEFHYLGNVPLFVCSPVSGSFGRQATYRLYEYKEGRLTYRTQYIEENK